MLQLILTTALLVPTGDVRLVEDPVIVPMTHATKHVTVYVHLNGKGPFLFQVDTYSSGDGSIDDDLARKLGLVKSGTTLSSDGQKTVSKDLVAVAELRLGGATFDDLVLTVNDYSWIKRPDGKQVQGILGFASFRELLLTFDYPGNRLILDRNGLTREEPHTIPFSVADTGSPDIRLTLDGREFVFGIDTGHQGQLTFIKSVGEHLPFHAAPKKTGGVRTHFSSFDVFHAVLEGTFDFAGHSVQSVGIGLIDGFGRGLVGYGLLRSYAVSFDQRAGLVRFKLPPMPKAVRLSTKELERWVGTYGGGSRRFSIEREGDALFFRSGDLPRVATIPLTALKLRLETEPTHLLLRKGWFGGRRLGIQTHPDGPVEESGRN